MQINSGTVCCDRTFRPKSRCRHTDFFGPNAGYRSITPYAFTHSPSRSPGNGAAIIKSDSRLLVDLSADGSDYSVGRMSTSLGRSAVSTSPFCHRAIQKEMTPSVDTNDEDERSEVSSLTGASFTSTKRTSTVRFRASRKNNGSPSPTRSLKITSSQNDSMSRHARGGGTSSRNNPVRLKSIIAPQSPVLVPNSSGKYRKKPPSIITTGLDGFQHDVTISPLP
jgi:hypothetical protein